MYLFFYDSDRSFDMLYMVLISFLNLELWRWEIYLQTLTAIVYKWHKDSPNQFSGDVKDSSIFENPQV